MKLFEKAMASAAKLAETSNCTPLFIDDVERNVALAEKVGMLGFVFESHSHFVFWLRKRGIYLT